MIVGIDFGTCFSSVAIMNGHIPVTTYVKDTTGVGIPSLFMFSRELNTELYGEDCLTGDAFDHEGDIVRHMKRTVRENPDDLCSKVKSGGKEYTIGEVIEKYLAFLISEAKKGAVKSGEFSNTDIEAITVTAPVGISKGAMMASEYNKLLQDTVMRITGLGKDRVSVIHEPVGAAISYLYSEDIRSHYDGKQTILVFDLGGGTLDVTVVEHDPRMRTYEIKAREGDLRLGGNDWDAALAEAVLEKVGTSMPEDRREAAEFMRNVTDLKISLSKTENSMIFFTDGGEDRYTRVSRQEFEDATSELTGRAMDVVRKAVESYEGGLEGIDRIVLVGGSCNMPQILARMKEDFGAVGEDNIMLFDPSKAIAKGAAVHAKMQSSPDGSALGGRILDCAALTYGFESRKNLVTPMIYNMIYKGSPFGTEDAIRVRSECTFVPLRDDQTSVSFEIYESEAKRGEDGDDWMDLGSGEVFNGLVVSVQVPPEYLGHATRFNMYASMSLDPNGILELTILDTAGNKLAYGSSASEARHGREAQVRRRADVLLRDAGHRGGRLRDTVLQVVREQVPVLLGRVRRVRPAVPDDRVLVHGMVAAHRRRPPA